jgi:hypothetical protein
MEVTMSGGLIASLICGIGVVFVLVYIFAAERQPKK